MSNPIPDPFSVDEHDESGVKVIHVAGELDIATAPRLCARLDATRTGRRPRLLVDLTDVDFCDSTGLRALLGAASEVRAHGGRFAIVCPPSGDVARLLEIVGAGEWMAIHADPASGMARAQAELARGCTHRCLARARIRPSAVSSAEAVNCLRPSDSSGQPQATIGSPSGIGSCSSACIHASRLGTSADHSAGT